MFNSQRSQAKCFSLIYCINAESSGAVLRLILREDSGRVDWSVGAEVMAKWSGGRERCIERLYTYTASMWNGSC